MDLSPADNNNKSLPHSDGETDLVSEKRQMENVESKELAAKRAKIDVGEIRKVAEIVLVLSAMAGMRGGAKNPTEAEVKLMEEARAKLVEICQDLAPKDLVARDSIGTVIEDLGLNSKLKDQRLGFRGSRLSIKEKLSLSKRKVGLLLFAGQEVISQHWLDRKIAPLHMRARAHTHTIPIADAIALVDLDIIGYMDATND